MEKFVIKTARKESIATAPNNDKLLKRKSQTEKDKRYEKKRKREFQRTWLIDFPWLRYKETLVATQILRADNSIFYREIFCT